MTTIHPPLEIHGLPNDLKDKATLTSSIDPPPYFDASKFQVEYLQGSEVRQAIQKEVTKLSENLKTLEEDFHEISVNMGELDDADLIETVRGKPIRYRPRWNEIHDEFTNLISTSKRSAVTVKAMIDELVLVFLPKIEKTENPIDSKESLTEYIESLKKFSKEGDDITLRFKRLRQSIAEFQNKLAKDANRQLDRVKDKIEEIDAKIKRLEEEVTVISRAASGFKSLFSSKGKSSVDITTVAGAKSLFTIAPEVETGMMIATLERLDPGRVAKAKEILKDQSVRTNDVTALKIQREAIGFVDEEVKVVVEFVGKLGPKFEGMIGKVSSIHQIYQMISKDCEVIGVRLSEMKESENKERFGGLLNLIKATYATFSHALERYSLST